MKKNYIFKLRVTHEGARYDLALYFGNKLKPNEITFSYKMTIIEVQVSEGLEIAFDYRDSEKGIEVINETLKEKDFNMMHIDWRGVLKSYVMEGVG